MTTNNTPTNKISKEDAQNALNCYTHCENYSLAGRELGTDGQTIKRRVVAAKKMGLEPDPEYSKTIRVGGKKRVVPFSEMLKQKDASPDECIEELLRVWEDKHRTYVTREYFRKKSNLADSAWNCHFGTFHEFRRQANLELSRHQHQLERQVAKHAASDNYRELNLEKQGYEAGYLKPCNKRFKTYVAAMDLHDQLCDPFYRRVFIDTVKRVQPCCLILNGDIFDLYEFGSYTQDPRLFKPIESIAWVHEFLGDCREVCPDMQIDFLEGNHEYRMLRHLSEASPALKTILADLHGMHLPEILGIDEYEINYIAKADLSAFTKADTKKELGKNWKVYDDSFMASHYPKDRLRGYPGFNGHHHSHYVWSYYNPKFQSCQWHQSGCGHIRVADYCDGELWNLGFPIIHVDTKKTLTNFEYIDIKDHAIVGGKWYVREPEEFITDL